MKTIAAALLVLLISLPIIHADEPRQKVQVDGKVYPVYPWGVETKPLRVVNPIYPVEAVNEDRGGEVLVGAVVNEKGKVRGTFVAKSTADRDIQHAVRMAVEHWRFPVIKEGDKAIAYVVFVPFLMHTK